MDLAGYDAYMPGNLVPYDLPDEELLKTEAILNNLRPAEMRKSGKW